MNLAKKLSDGHFLYGGKLDVGYMWLHKWEMDKEAVGNYKVCLTDMHNRFRDTAIGASQI